MKTGHGKHFIITGHTIASIRRNVLEPLAEMFGVNTKLSGQENSFNLWGNSVHCFGTDKADSYKVMTGMTAHGWYGNEVTLTHPNSLQEAFNRCSGENANIFWDTNPDFPEHPIKTDYIDKSGEKLSSDRIRIRSHHFALDDNPFLTLDYTENLKKSTPKGMWYDRKILGLWVAAEGLVYENFDRDTHVVKPFKIPDHWRRFRAIDFGFSNPFVCLWGATDEDGRLYIYDEHYQNQRLMDYHAGQIKARGGKYDWTVSDHDAQNNAELRSQGVSTQNAQKELMRGIEKVAQRLIIKDDSRPRLMIFNTCKRTIQEFGMYQYPERRVGKVIKEEPVDKDNHSMDALRYMIMQLDNKGCYIYVRED